MTNLFEVITPTGLIVRTTFSYWEKIVTLKHPSMNGREADVKETLYSPMEIRVSRKDENIHLYYKPFRLYFLCVVVKKTDGEGFVVTTYMTEKIKEGIQIWPR